MSEVVVNQVLRALGMRPSRAAMTMNNVLSVTRIIVNVVRVVMTDVLIAVMCNICDRVGSPGD